LERAESSRPSRLCDADMTRRDRKLPINEGAPVFDDDVEPQWTRGYEQDIHDHYGVRPY
jgi:hypothetical protein